MWVQHLVPQYSACTRTTIPGILDDASEPGQLIGFCSANSITEVYLALGPQATVLTDPRLPSLISDLKALGQRVDALITCTSVDSPTCADGTWKTRLGQVMAYNQGHPANESFDGIHLDLEPWVQTGSCDVPPCHFPWVDDLIGYYQYVSDTLSGSGLTMAADIAGAKLKDLFPADQQALLDTATRLVLMEYGVSADAVHARVTAFQSTVNFLRGSFMIATRVQDFGWSSCQNGAVLKGFDAAPPDGFAGTAGYAGWATFKYSAPDDCNHYNDASICPGDCCLIGP